MRSAFACIGLLLALSSSASADVIDGLAAPRSASRLPLVTNIPGIDQNITNVQTASYTVQPSDCGKIILAGTGSSGLFTLTLPAVTNFPSNCVVSFHNGDTGTPRGKVLSGFPGDFGLGSMLWPDQFGQVGVINGAWQTRINPGFYINPATINVNHASGSDAATNDCLGTGSSACATIGRAITIIQNYTQCPTTQALIQVAQETFTESVPVTGTSCGFGTSNCVIIQGTPVTPDNTVWQVSSGTGLSITDYACVIPNGFKMVGTSSNVTAMAVGKYSDLAFKNIDFGTFTSGVHISITWGHSVFEGGSYTISGNVGTHIVNNGGVFEAQGGNYTINSGLGFNNWLQETNNAKAYFTTTCSGIGCGGSSTGAKYNVASGSSLILNGTTLPGATAGTCADSSDNRASCIP